MESTKLGLPIDHENFTGQVDKAFKLPSSLYLLLLYKVIAKKKGLDLEYGAICHHFIKAYHLYTVG
jgi:hypothetical protein